MTLIPTPTTEAAVDLLARGYRPIEPIGRVEPPLGVQLSAAMWISDWCWQAMVLRQMAAAGKAHE